MSAVVYENAYGVAIWFPDISATAVVTFTLYVVASDWPLAANTAWLFEQLNNVHPGLSDVILAVFTDVQSMFSVQLIVTLLFSAIFVAPFAGIEEITEGAVLSTVTVIPAEGVSILLDESMARL